MSTVFDPDRLADITRTGTATPATVLAAFRRDLALDLGKLRLAADAADIQQVSTFAHRLEGACRMLGAGALAQAAADIAAISVGRDPALLASALDRFEQRQAELFKALDVLVADTGARSAAPQQGIGEAQPQLCAGLVFFVVEDHDFQRDMLVRLLRQLGAREVRGFADGAAALEAARDPVAVGAILVVDLAMPGLNGVELARKIGLERIDVAIILNSALAQDLLSWPLQTARSAGVTVLGAIHKPVTHASLAPLIAQHRHNLQAGKR